MVFGSCLKAVEVEWKPVHQPIPSTIGATGPNSEAVGPMWSRAEPYRAGAGTDPKEACGSSNYYCYWIREGVCEIYLERLLLQTKDSWQC